MVYEKVRLLHRVKRKTKVLEVIRSLILCQKGISNPLSDVLNYVFKISPISLLTNLSPRAKPLDSLKISSHLTQNIHSLNFNFYFNYQDNHKTEVLLFPSQRMEFTFFRLPGHIGLKFNFGSQLELHTGEEMFFQILLSILLQMNF